MNNDNKPRHIGIIPDGNRRWAKQKGLPAWEGHREGAKTFEKLLEWCKELGIKELSFWATSTENMKREKKEVDYILKLFDQFLNNFLNDYKNKKAYHQVKIRFIGNIENFPSNIHRKMRKVEELTAKNSGYRLNMLVGYGGRWEITQAAKKIAKEVKEGKIRIEDITPEAFQKHLQLQSEPDLIIRTSEERLSGFLPWQAIYSEIIFIKNKHWPEFSKEDLKKCIEEYSNRQRRFGK